MSKHRPLFHGNCVPQSFFDALQEFISTNASNFTLQVVPGTVNRVQVYATPDNGQVGVGINGLWRYNTAPVQATVSGPPGTYDLFVTAGKNNFYVNTLPPPPETDGTDYSFGLVSVQAGTTPTGVDHFRKCGEADFDGTHVTLLRNLIGGAGATDPTELCYPGMISASAAPAPPPGWLLCDGSAVSRETYWRLFAALGGDDSPWGLGDGGTTFNVPDLRGRTLLGASSGPITGLTARELGTKLGVETVKLNAAQSGANPNAVTDEGNSEHSHPVQGTTQPGGTDHTHAVNGSTQPVADHAHSCDTVNIDHAHGIDAQATNESGAHSHSGSVVTAPAYAGKFAAVRSALDPGATTVTDVYAWSAAPGNTSGHSFATHSESAGWHGDRGWHEHSLSVGQAPAHVHTIPPWGTGNMNTNPTHTHTIGNGGGHSHSMNFQSGPGGGAHQHDLDLTAESGGAHTHNLVARDADDAHDNMMPCAAVNYFIKV